LHAGHDVTVLARSQGKCDGSLPSGASFVAGDVCDPASLDAALRHNDVVCHAAGIPRCVNSDAYREAAMHEVNAEGTRNVCRAAALAGVRQVVIISSITIYGPNRNKLLVEEDDCRPEDSYAASKLKAEEFAAAVSAEFGHAVTVLRLGPLYGPGHAGNVRRLLEAIERRRFYPVGRGLNRKSLLHVDDAARACCLAVEFGGHGRQPFSVYNVAGQPVEVREIVAHATEAVGRDGYRGHFPALPFRMLSRAGLCPRAIERWLADEAIDSSRFIRDFGWRPEIDLADGFRSEAGSLRSASSPWQKSIVLEKLGTVTDFRRRLG
jgi:UDP-glucose 4-epimerase